LMSLRLALQSTGAGFVVLRDEIAILREWWVSECGN
jgi:hypothetical protein